MGLSIGIDIGGTFVDVVALDTSTGELVSTKMTSTPRNFAQGFYNALDKVLGLAGASFSDIERLIHGTTVATNAIAEAKGAKLGILTTKGFRDVLFVGWGLRRSEDLYSTQHDAMTPDFLCERERIMEVKERIDSQGNVLTPLDEGDVIAAADYLLQKHAVETIVVSYLFSFLNPTHEERTKQIINERYPNVKVSLSSEVNPRLREYERLVITAFDGYVRYAIERYITQLEKGLQDRDIDVVLQVMQSRGGITSATICREKPVVTILSGPAAGVVGANFIASLLGLKNLVTFDMGGTTCDAALIRDGKPYLSIESRLFGKYPLRQAMLDMSTIGAGGGSIAWVDPAGGLRVGPESVGADPGPACYGWGGDKPTVTDASVILGYLNPEYFAEGELALNSKLARRAVQESIGRPLNMDVTEASAGIHKIVNNTMANQLRLLVVRKGYDPRDFSLVAFGGAGPVAVGRLLQLLRFKDGIVPNKPGVLSAFGLLTADVEHEEVMTSPLKVDEADPKDIEEVFGKVEKVCEQKREGVGISRTQLRIYHSTEMRYVGQAYEIEIPFPEAKGEITKDIIQNIGKRFHDVHQSIYQHSQPDTPVEFIAFRVVFSQKSEPAPTLDKLSSGTEAAPKGWRQAYFDEYKGFVDTPLYERATLGLGQKIGGPAIVEQPDTTTVIYPNQQAEVDEWGNLIIRAT